MKLFVWEFYYGRLVFVFAETLDAAIELAVETYSQFFSNLGLREYVAYEQMLLEHTPKIYSVDTENVCYEIWADTIDVGRYEEGKEFEMVYK